MKLLIQHRSTSLDRIFSDSRGNRYVSSFDLNATDVNEQSGLFSAVLANRVEILAYLLDLKFKKLDDLDCQRIQAKEPAKTRHSLNSNSSIIGSKSVPADLSHQHRSENILEFS